MKKSLFLISAAVLLNLAGGTAPVFAAEEGGTMPTNGTVNFVPGEDPTDPTDPTDPGNPIDPVDPPTPVGGSLSIDYASRFKFGAQKISSTDETYYAALDKFKDADGKEFEDNNYVQVTDKRGTLAGWNLSVKQEGQFATAEKEELTGAQIKIAKASLIAAINDNSLDAYKPSTVVNSITLTPNQEAPAINAEAGKGAGTWVYRFGDDNEAGKTAIELSVPGKTVKLAKEYTTKLNWQLANVPSNPETPSEPV